MLLGRSQLPPYSELNTHARLNPPWAGTDIVAPCTLVLRDGAKAGLGVVIERRRDQVCVVKEVEEVQGKFAVYPFRQLRRLLYIEVNIPLTEPVEGPAVGSKCIGRNADVCHVRQGCRRVRIDVVRAIR